MAYGKYIVTERKEDVKKSLLVLLINIAVIIVCTGYASALRYDGPYEGRVVDARTGDPIKGVVVLGIWYKGQFSSAGTTHRFYDAKETVTDHNGEFKIPGLGLQILSGVEPMNVLIFKAGYEYIDTAPWKGLKKGVVLSKKVRWEGKKAIIRIIKWSTEERRKYGTPSFPPEAYEQRMIPLLIKELNREKKYLGKPLYPEE